MKFLAWLLVISAVAPRLYSGRAPEGEIHAVIVAGSDGWWNYRHQADACHAYHTLRRHGIPPQNIILMMYDDVAHHSSNPYKGKLYNKPWGEDVYKGVKIDYSGRSVTPQNFLNVLKGNASGVVGGNGRVLQSKQNDRVFIFYSDHGGVGTLAFPIGTLTVKQLNETLNWMYENEKYNQLVFYLEACHSGSMFDATLTNDINAYASTAAHRGESSYATYCNNPMRLPCLGDEFSVHWMEDTDEKDINNETLQEQYQLVKERTKESHVMQYGDLYITQNPVSWFQGEERLVQKSRLSATENLSKQESWPAFDVELMSLYQLMESTNDPQKAKQYEREIQKIQDDRRNIESIYKNLVDDLISDAEKRTEILKNYDPVKDLDCHDEVVQAFTSRCVNWNKYDYALKLNNVLNNLCTHLGDSGRIIEAMQRTCSRTNSRFL